MKDNMVNVFILGMVLLFHATSASDSTTETDGAWKRMMEKRMDLMKQEIAKLKRQIIHKENVNIPALRTDDGMNEALMNDTDLEERVTFLEFQMVNVNEELVTITEDLIDVENGVENVEAQITVILADQVIQNERLLELETDAESVAVAVVGLDNSVNTLQTIDVALNDSILELDSRVFTLEGLNTTIVDLAVDVEELEVMDSELALQIDELNTRLVRLEQNGTVAFHAVLGAYTSIPEGSVIVFPNININLGDGYNGATGEFTVPVDGDGVYYFYVHFLYDLGDRVFARIQVNGNDLCVAYEDELNTPNFSASSCGAVVALQAGDVVLVRYTAEDDTPFHSTSIPASTFTGIRIAPL